jgi:hypothetical protein
METILVGKEGSEFELPHIGCFGDESRMCCNVLITSQVVVATGVMELRSLGDERGWFFQDKVRLCVL